MASQALQQPEVPTNIEVSEISVGNFAKTCSCQIMVRSAPNGGHYYNGLISLEDCLFRIEPGLRDFSENLRARIINQVHRDLFSNTLKAPKKAVFFALEPLQN